MAAGMLSLCLGYAETNRIILQEDFESFKTTKALRAAWPGGPAELMTNAPGGGHAAGHNGTGMNRRGGFFVFPDATHNLILQADFYDFATNTDQNVIVSINGEDPHDNVGFGLKGSYCYMARVGGFSSNTNWISFKRGQLPVRGWHRFKAIISVTNATVALDLEADGEVDGKLDFPFNRVAPTFTQIRFGGYSGQLAERGIALVDNIKLELISLEPAVVASTSSNRNDLPAVTPHSNPLPQGDGEPVPPLAERVRAGATNRAETNVSILQPSNDVAESAAQRSTVGTDAGKLITPSIANPTASAPASGPATSQAPQVNASLPAPVWWICAALALIIGLLGAVIWMLRRQGTVAPRALLTEGNDDGNAKEGDMVAVAARGEDHWRDRALQAEAIAAKQAEILGEKVGPELVEFAKETLVQGLYTQRNALLETQVKAKQTLIELEARLSELHLPAQERIRAYEKRITELERQLESRDDEMRELTRATLLLVQERLEEERAQQGPRFN